MFANTRVAPLLLSLLLATTIGGSITRRGVRVTATEVVLVGAATSSDVASVEEDVEDGNNNEEADGPIAGGGFVVEEAPPKEQKLAPVSTIVRRRTLKTKNDKASTATTGQACVSPGKSCAEAECCYGNCVASANINSCELCGGKGDFCDINDDCCAGNCQYPLCS